MNNPDIASSICNLNKYIDNSCTVEQVEFIQNNLFKALDARFDSKKELENYVMQDCDPLEKNITEGIDENDRVWESVRDIQSDIINDFSISLVRSA